MNMIKKAFYVVMAVVTALCLAACTSNEDPSIQQLPDEFLRPASVACGPTDGRSRKDYQFGFLWGGQSDYYNAMPMMFEQACAELDIPVPVDATPKTGFNRSRTNR